MFGVVCGCLCFTRVRFEDHRDDDDDGILKGRFMVFLNVKDHWRTIIVHPTLKSSHFTSKLFPHLFFWGFPDLTLILVYWTSPLFTSHLLRASLDLPIVFKNSSTNFPPSLQRELQRGRIDRFREICADFAWKATKRIPCHSTSTTLSLSFRWRKPFNTAPI